MWIAGSQRAEVQAGHGRRTGSAFVSALAICLLTAALGQAPSTVNVFTVSKLRNALLANATSVAILANMKFTPENWPDPPVLITRAVTIYSPYRVELDFCGKSAPARVLLNVTTSGSLLLQRVFLHNFLPSAQQDLSGLGPVPALLSSGGLITFKLVAFHFLPNVTWVFDPALAPGSFWAAEQKTVMKDVYKGTPLQLQQPALYSLQYQSPPTATARYKIENCFSPMDIRFCYDDDREDTALVYCLYTLADSLRNPNVRYARVFHDLGLDRAAFSRNKAILLDQPKSYSACPGASPSLNMDKILYGVIVRASLEFSGLRFKGSLPTNFTTWPPSLPLLLSMFDVDGTGSLSLSNSVVEVGDLAAVVATLQALPGCCTADVSRPNLQPDVDAWPSPEVLAPAKALAAATTTTAPAGDGDGSSGSGGGGVIEGAWQLPAAAAQPPSFTIMQWVLPKNSWLQYGAPNPYDSLLRPSSATWRFTDVMVMQGYEANTRALCFEAALEQGAVTRGQVALVANDTQLRAALLTGRYIQVVSDIKFNPSNWPTGNGVLVPGGGMVEVRGCHPIPGRRYTLDLSDLQGVVRSTGRLIFQGDLRFVGVGWTSLRSSELLHHTHGKVYMSPVGAFLLDLNAQGIPGSVEFEGVVIEGLLSLSGLRPRDLLDVLHLSHMTPAIRTLNVSLRGDDVTLGLWTVVEDAPQDGSWGFTHTEIVWTDVPAETPAGDDNSHVAKILIPSVIVGSVLLLALGVLTVAYVRCRRRRCSQPEASCALRNHTTLVLQKLAAAGAAAGMQGDRRKSLSSSVAPPIVHVPSDTTGSNDSGGDASPAAALHAATKIFNVSTAESNASASASAIKTDVSGAAMAAAAALATLEQARSEKGRLDVAARQESVQAAAGAGAAGEVAPKAAPGAVLLDGRDRGPLGDIDAAKCAMVAGLGSSIDDLVLQNVLGEGSYGRVYRALWRGTTVAVKIILLPAHMSGRERHERMAVMEAAISSSLSHPNIVQTYTYGVEVVEGPKARATGMQRARTQDSGLPYGSTIPLDGTRQMPPQQNSNGTAGDRVLATGSEEDMLGWEIRLVQEYCDLGSLRDKLNDRVFLRPVPAAAPNLTAATPPLLPPASGGVVAASLAAAGEPVSVSTVPAPPTMLLQSAQSFGSLGVTAAAAVASGGGGGYLASSVSSRATGMSPSGGSGVATAMVVDLEAVLDTAIDVARALVHLHREGIIHADLKPRNVLLKGSTTDPRGFVAKVADFGLSARLDAHETHVSNAYHGTMAYMAPETMLHGHVSRASDVYGFGILLYELYTSDTAFRGVPKALLGHAITKENLRPVFPPALGAPFEYQLLACRCWESNPEIRPEFDFILEDLKRMRVRLCSQLHPRLCVDASGVNTAGGSGWQATGDVSGGGRWVLPQLPLIRLQGEASFAAVSQNNAMYGNYPDGDRSLSGSSFEGTLGTASALAAGVGLTHNASHNPSGFMDLARQLMAAPRGIHHRTLPASGLGAQARSDEVDEKAAEDVPLS